MLHNNPVRAAVRNRQSGAASGDSQPSSGAPSLGPATVPRLPGSRALTHHASIARAKRAVLLQLSLSRRPSERFSPRTGTSHRHCVRLGGGPSRLQGLSPRRDSTCYPFRRSWSRGTRPAAGSACAAGILTVKFPVFGSFGSVFFGVSDLVQTAVTVPSPHGSKEPFIVDSNKVSDRLGLTATQSIRQCQRDGYPNRGPSTD